MEKGNGLESLSTLTVLRTYSKDGEDWGGITKRYLDFMKKLYPSQERKIRAYGHAIYNKLCVPSMRLFQFAGPVAEQENLRAFNCSFLAPIDFKDFGDMCYLLCVGAGVGVSVEGYYVSQIPEIPQGKEEVFVIPDSKEGWADSFIKLIENKDVEFDYSLVRPKGAPLSSGGSASGPEPLKESHKEVRRILNESNRLSSVNVADIACLIANCVVSGGQRRSALIILYNSEDKGMAEFKCNSWWNDTPWRAKANISATAVKYSDEVVKVLDNALNSMWGEPGLVLKTNGNYKENQGVNPCCEISLCNHSVCNLSEVIVSNCQDEEDFIYACQAASFFGTLQAGLTNFNYVKEDWSRIAKEEALLGVSLTGQAMNQSLMSPNILQRGAKEVNRINSKTAKDIGINEAKRTTCTKPSGSTSASTGSTSGIHAAYARKTIRRVRVTKASTLGEKLIELYGISNFIPTKDDYGNIINKPTCKHAFIVHEAFGDKDIVLQFPCEYKGDIFRAEETSIQLLNRMKVVYDNWILIGHREGEETNNVSLTVEFKPKDKESIKKWMLENQEAYRGVSFLPNNGGNYPLAPFEEVDDIEFQKYVDNFPNIDWEALGIKADIQGTSACSGGQCEIQ